MYSETFGGAIDAVASVLGSVRTITVLDYVPPPGAVGSPCVIVDRDGARVAEDAYTIPVRIYVAASKHGGVRDAQLVLDETVDAIDEAFADDSAPFSGGMQYIEASDVWFGDFTTTVSRT